MEPRSEPAVLALVHGCSPAPGLPGGDRLPSLQVRDGAPGCREQRPLVGVAIGGLARGAWDGHVGQDWSTHRLRGEPSGGGEQLPWLGLWDIRVSVAWTTGA